MQHNHQFTVESQPKLLDKTTLKFPVVVNTLLPIVTLAPWHIVISSGAIPDWSNAVIVVVPIVVTVMVMVPIEEHPSAFVTVTEYTCVLAGVIVTI